MDDPAFVRLAAGESHDELWWLTIPEGVGQPLSDRVEAGAHEVLVAALAPMGLSARDVSMTTDDCVHYNNQTPFPVYEEMVKFLIALAGRDCAKLVGT